MTPRERCLCALLGCVSAGAFGRLEEILSHAPELGCSRTDLEEILLQGHLFAGFPRAIESLECLERILGQASMPPRSSPPQGECASAGWALFRQIYDRQSDAVIARIRALHPDLGTWVLEHAYGRVLSRPHLEARLLELAAVTALIASSSWRQLASHLRGAQRCGARGAEILAAIAIAGLLVGPGEVERARQMARDIDGTEN